MVSEHRMTRYFFTIDFSYAFDTNPVFMFEIAPESASQIIDKPVLSEIADMIGARFGVSHDFGGMVDEDLAEIGCIIYDIDEPLAEQVASAWLKVFVHYLDEGAVGPMIRFDRALVDTPDDLGDMFDAMMDLTKAVALRMPNVSAGSASPLDVSQTVIDRII